MFHNSRALTRLRELVMRAASVESVLGPIQGLLWEQPDPDAVAKSIVAKALTE
jgi:hypothetical protein